MKFFWYLAVLQIKDGKKTCFRSSNEEPLSLADTSFICEMQYISQIKTQET